MSDDADEVKPVVIEGGDLKKLQAFARAELEKMRPPDGTPTISTEPTPYAVLCRSHGKVYLTKDEYNRQMCAPDSRWSCPECGRICDFDDDNYEASLEGEPEE